MGAGDHGDNEDNADYGDYGVYGVYGVVGSTPVFQGRVIGLRVDRIRMSDGSVAEREIVSHPGAVGVLALDDDEQVVLVNQYRVPVRVRLDELPAGLLDVAGEDPLNGARRELAEEARLAATTWHTLVDLHTSPGMTDEAIRVYLARGLAPAGDEFVAEHEELTLQVRRVPLADAVAAVFAGRITNAVAVAGILAAAQGLASGWSSLRPAGDPWP